MAVSMRIAITSSLYIFVWLLQVQAHPVHLSPDMGVHLGDSMPYYLRLLVCVLLVLIGGLLSGLTLGLMSLDEMNLNILATSGTPMQQLYAKRIQPIRKNGHWLLVTLLLGNTIVNETLPIIMHTVLGGGGVTAVIVSTAAIVLFGEIIPQSICAHYGLTIGAMFAYPVRLLQYALAPLAYPIALLLDAVLGASHGATYKKAQLKELVSMSDSAHGGSLSTDEITIIRGALDLSEKRVANVMTDLRNVFMVDLDMHLDRALLTEILKRGYSRVPVYHTCREHIVGVLLVKSLILLDPDDAVPVRDTHIAPVPIVTTDTSLYDILNAFQEGGSHMAVVVGMPVPEDSRCALGIGASLSSETTLVDESAALLSDATTTDHRMLPNYLVAKTQHKDLDSYVPIGIITLEDVIEELIQEEIIDETDEFVDIRRRIRVVRAAQTMLAELPAAKRQISRGLAFSARRRQKAMWEEGHQSQMQMEARPQSVPSSTVSPHDMLVCKWMVHTPHSYASETPPYE